MVTSIDKTVLRAAEAALAHLVMTSKMVDSKMVSEGTLYETIGLTLKTHGCEWVNHEHKVDIEHTPSTRNDQRGDKKRVDYGVKHGKKVTLIEVKIASRTTLMKKLDVSTDMEKLVDSKPINAKAKEFADTAYLIVYNLQTFDTHGDDCGHIEWEGAPLASSVHCIGRFIYRSKRFVRTAVVYRVDR